MAYPGAEAAYLHIIRDEKFIDAARALFESAAPGLHRFVVVGAPGPFVHLKTFVPEIVPLEQATGPAFLGQLARSRVVFLHGLSHAARWIVSRAPASTRFVWIGWGGDYYHLIRPGDELLLPETRALVAGLREARYRARWLRRLRIACNVLWRPWSWPAFLARLRMDRDLRRLGPGMGGEAALLAKISLFAPVLREEYGLLTEAHPGFGPGLAEWNYDINQSLEHARRAQAPALGDNILLGNSATPENNHADAFALMGELGGRTVVCPLGYGDASYASAIRQLGKETLGQHFHPLADFVPALQYADLMRSCGIVVMNHRRQQALGTINAALCNGAKVFLRPENPLHAFYRSLGVQIFSVDELRSHLGADAPALDDTQVAHARTAIDANFGPAALQRKTRRLLEACEALPRKHAD
ncbi:TDP-N-acetylfucosamine:lipid II N-acetylfucosaminyltransferase [Ramlibacter sp.]|uniref:TDP-N-acetylfucosamine:lipid II N-acetylfucosaminyltransferase n=1 Tax=Ramlibacter sp. TaxID=1917967 RepID=UPI002FC670BC